MVNKWLWYSIDDLTNEDVLQADDITRHYDELDGIVGEGADPDVNPEDLLPSGLGLEDAKQLFSGLKEFQKQIEGYHAELFIQDTFFPKYARDYAEDCGALKNDAEWPHNCINWDEAIDEFKQDYSSVTVNLVDYWYR